MKMLTFKGNCPACNLQGTTVTMRYNIAHELECPICNLRVYNEGKKLALIYRLRGKNEFAVTPTPPVLGEILFTRADVVYDTYSDGSLLLDSQALEQYLSEVNPKACRSILEALVASYIQAFYYDNQVEYYFLLSELAGIDISQTVFKNTEKSSIYLFQFMHFIIACYDKQAYNQLNQFLPTSQILELVDTHVTPYIDLLKNDVFLQQLVLKNLIVASIKQIYAPHYVSL